MNSEAVRTYIAACNREHAECAQELVDALSTNAKVAQLGQRAVPLNDIDVCCVAEAIHAMDDECALKVLNLEENSFGLQGVQTLMEAIEANPGRIKELRLGKNNLKDQAAVAIGHTLSRGGCGLKVLDLSENGITKSGVIPIAAALQSPTSDLVELSFHNNKIEGDAANFLAQAIRVAPKLKHLHLGYNSMHDNGAAQLAKSLPHAKCLSTLDLTANRIGHDGGLEIARALMRDGCTLQRLNLRHNLLDSTAMAAFADVLHKNTSLIQLFLGFMNPAPEVAEGLLKAARDSPSLLLLDMYGWRLDVARALPLIRAVQEGTGAIAAIVTDACQSIAADVDEGNITRESRDLHPIYVGPDDRDAYLATRSLRRYSRAQSRRQSRLSSARASRSRGAAAPSPGDEAGASRASSRHGSRRHSRRRSRRGSLEALDTTHPGLHEVESAGKPSGPAALVPAPAHAAPLHRRRRSSSRRPRAGEPPTPQNDLSAVESPDWERSPKSASRPGREGDADGAEAQREVDRMLDVLQDTPCDPKTAEAIAAIVRALQSQIRHQRARHRKEVGHLKARLEVLEARRECRCGVEASRGPSAARPNGMGGNNAWAGNSINTGGNGYTPNAKGTAAPVAPAGSTMGPIAGGNPGSSAVNSGSRQPRGASQSVPYHRSASRASEAGGYEQAVTPLVRPKSESRDVLPELPRPNDESGERRPEEASLQRSASVRSFPPPIEPSPTQDADPPRRKSVAHNF